jgi:hypothetical protein
LQFVLFGLGLAVLGLVGGAFYGWVAPDVNDILTRGRVPRIPESAQDVRVSTDRNTYRLAVFVKFRATSTAIADFVNGTSGMLPESPASLRTSWFKPQAYPSWWLPEEGAEGCVYHLSGERYSGVLVTVEETNSVHVSIEWYRPRWRVRLSEYFD